METIIKRTDICIINDSGLEITLSTIGASIKEVKVLDKDGIKRLVTLAPITEEEYINNYHGKIVGRTAGRIENAMFSIDGKTAYLDKNNFAIDNLHSGDSCFSYKTFNYGIIEEKEYTDIIFTTKSFDGEGGYFGDVILLVTYRVFSYENKFKVIIEGIVSEKTLLNITNHVYWNLSGDLREAIDNHCLYINSSKYGVLNERFICNQIESVNKYFDFRNCHKIGKYLNHDFVTQYTSGYDHPFVLDSKGMNDIACTLKSELSGIELNIKTTYPCVVFYSDNLGGNLSNMPKKQMAVCLECQYLPNGINMNIEECGICSTDKPYYNEIEYSFK